MKIVVTTPTGNVGSQLTRMLIQAGLRPTLLVRDPARLDAAVRERADVVVGDQLRADDVLRATEGADALYWVNPPTGAPDPIAAHTQLGAIVAEAVRENSIPRVVFQSSVGAELRRGAGEIDGLAATEQALDGTGADVLHLRCGLFFTNLLLDPAGLEEGVLRVTWPVDRPLPWVDPRDIAEVAAVRLLAGGWSDREVQAVHGPEDLTYEQVATIIAEVTGRPMRAEQIPDDAMREGLRAVGLTDAQIEALIGMSIGLRQGFVPENPRTFTTTTPTTLGAWAFANLRQAGRNLSR